MKWHKLRNKAGKTHPTCEGFGVALRLFQTKTKIITDVLDFFSSAEFNSAIANRFRIDIEECNIDGGIQKYLDGYEISPHPDIRRKAATFMVNINPNPKSEECEHHTHYLELISSRKYIYEFWEGNSQVDRAWLPWSWAKSCMTQSANNSIVIFSPTNTSLHAVKANYDHLCFQRTQLYGNIWYKEANTIGSVEWQGLDVLSNLQTNQQKLEIGFRNKIKKLTPNFLLRKYHELRAKEKVGKRNIDG
jgi:hypothetical protein